MFDTNIKKNRNNEQTRLFFNRISETKPSNHQNFIPNLAFPLRQQSVKSLNKINKHYEAFQHALHMLKISVEELWRLELEQLHNQKSISPNSSSMRFDFQVPSIYTCRAVLPMVSQMKPSQNEISSGINSQIILQPNSTATLSETVANRMKVEEKKSQSNTSSVSSKKKSNTSLLSIPKKKQRHDKSSDKFTKYSTKTAFLHLKFHCSKHRH